MDWSCLLPDLLGEIATKLNLFEDYTAFRGVCTSWRAAATKDKFVSVSKVPLLMLPEKDGDGDVREFYSLQKKQIFLRRPVPEAKGKRCIGAGFGWILTAPSSGEELSLAKPLSSAKIQLPDMKTSPEDEYENYSAYQLESYDFSYDFVYPKKKRYFIKRAVLSANPSETSDYVVMVVVNRNLAGYWWRNGDNYWTKLELGPRNLADICYHKHKLYATDWQGKVWMWDRHLLSPEILVALPSVSWRNCLERAYLVESSKGELLLIARRRYLYLHGYEHRYFEIIKIDLEERKISVIDNLGRDAVFVGLNSAASVAADDFPGVVKGNHIYIAKDDSGDDFNQGKTMGIYNVEDESIEIIDVLPCFIYMCPPLWIFPSL